jgi:hypothetical protein
VNTVALQIRAKSKAKTRSRRSFLKFFDWRALPHNPTQRESRGVVGRDGLARRGVGGIGILGCRFRNPRGKGGGGSGCNIGWRRREFAVGPDGAVGEIFFFPDGNGALERVDGEAAGFEGGGTVGCADSDEDAGLANFEAAETVRDGDPIDGEFCVDVGGDFFQLRERHRFVGFVVEIERAAAVRIVANAAVEGDDGAIGIGANVADERCGIDWVEAELEEVVGGGGRHGWTPMFAISRR